MALFSSPPSVRVVFVTLVVFRCLSALFNNVNDCDETYNYWEPAHFLLHSSGFQTWEYSPAYALRSYAYVLLNIFPLFLLINVSKIFQFYLLRIIFAIVCSTCETYMYSVVKKWLHPKISLSLFLLLVPSCAMYISSTAFLPSSFTMYCTMVAIAAWLDHKETVAIFAIALGSILGWPFAAALGIPLAVNIIFSQRRFLYFVACSFTCLVIIGVPVALFDSWMYGKFVFAPLNIIQYNVFGSGGPDLYGTEPWTYYFVNGFLNLNFAFILCLLCFFLVELKIFSDSNIQKVPKQQQTALAFRPIVFSVLIWIGIFFTRPHKEERFLFPIYPLMYICAAISLHLLNDLVPTFEYLFNLNKTFVKQLLQQFISLLTWYLIIFHALLSLSRIAILYNGYSSPMRLYSDLSLDCMTDETSSLREVNLCVGKEWYRFPSSFFLPNKHGESRWKLRFIRSEFRGQLPKPYSNSLAKATTLIPTDMNDLNKEELSRYFSIGNCHYLVDLEKQISTMYEPKYHQNDAVWNVAHTYMFLDSSLSSRTYRVFYIPWLTEKRVQFANYFLLKNIIKAAKQ